MPLIELIRRHMVTKPRVLLMLAGIAGISNTLVMAIINNVASTDGASPTFRVLLMFLLAIGIYAVSQRILLRITATEVETMIEHLRVGLVDSASRAELLPLEQVGRSEVLGAMIRDTQTISQAVNLLVIAAQSAILIALAMGYVLLNSLAAFILSFAFIAFAVTLVIGRMKKLQGDLYTMFGQEAQLVDGLRDVLDGFKGLLAEVQTNAVQVRDLKIHYQSRSSNEYVLGQSLIFMLLGVIVFLVPMFAQASSTEISRTTTAILFIIGPLGMVIQAVPMVAAANAAAQNLMQLDATLKSLSAQSAFAQVRPLPERFDEIHVDTVSFSYHDAKAASVFAVGPIDLSIRKGEILFITGGNGSGKSTLLKLLVGLYYPSSGMIRLDGQAITSETYDAYRNLFSVIFSDYHLFKHVYGLHAPDTAVVDDLCQLLELAGKVHMQGTAFNTLELSSGQRKRLALLVTLLEDKPVVVLDEWAADQDPHFRRKFYQELLPRLRAAGKTVVAITHDDRYFDCADRCLAMEEGQLVTKQKTGKTGRGTP
jgi:putative pyoverdin transport system ATP-binding/permease protein